MKLKISPESTAIVVPLKIDQTGEIEKRFANRWDDLIE
jgi:hypothetical protein